MGNAKRFVPLILFLLLVASVAGNAILYKKLRVLKQNPQMLAQEENKALVAKVGQLIVLPEGEEPTVATVNEPEKLKDQPFFANAKQGDKVLIYTKAKKAILYRTAENKIVEVAPVNIGEQPAVSAPEAPKE